MELRYRHTVILVDDENSITNALQRLFRKENYLIFTAPSGQEGLQLLNKLDKPVSLIISDQRMPGMSGSEFLERAKEIYPDAERFLLTGYSDTDAIIDAVNRGEIHRYFSKPWNDRELLLQVRQALEQFELKLENRRLLALTKKQNRELRTLNKSLEKKVEERSREIIQKNKELNRLNKDLEKNLFNTIRAFASLLKMHAPILAEHGRRVSRLSYEIAQELDLPEKEVIYVEIAALLHDIGKLGLPEKLIHSDENSLPSKEVDTFKRHPVEGQEIVRCINNLDYVGLLIRSHHERFDGSGYPDGLAKETIPLGSRIIGVANEYDRMVNLKMKGGSFILEYLKERGIHRNQVSGDELIRESAIFHLKKGASTRYDPDVIQAFLRLMSTNRITNQRDTKLTIGELKKGMILARSIYTRRGRFLLPHKTLLTEDQIHRLRSVHENDPIDGIWVSRPERIED